jgi:hypothetical protein
VKTYGVLITDLGKKSAERFFPRSRGGADTGDPEETGSTPAE